MDDDTDADADAVPDGMCPNDAATKSLSDTRADSVDDRNTSNADVANLEHDSGVVDAASVSPRRHLL